MEIYKLTIEKAQEYITQINLDWLPTYQSENPIDITTTGYTSFRKVEGFAYIIKDAITEQYITDFIEIVSDLPVIEPMNEII